MLASSSRLNAVFRRVRIRPKSYATFTKTVGNIAMTIDENTGIATLSLNKPPVNSLDLDFLKELTSRLTELEMRGCRGFVLTSAIPNVFCAGLDIVEMQNPEVGRFSTFWRAVQDVWMKLYLTELVSIAAVTGNAPGAGCILALSCDYRVMLSSSSCTIGISGTRLGMISPWWFQDVFIRTVGRRETELALSLAKSYAPQEALEKGLVDELAHTPASVVSSAHKQLQNWLKVQDHARRATKLQLRESMVQKLLATRDEDVDKYVAFVTRKDTQIAINEYLEKLRRKRQ